MFYYLYFKVYIPSQTLNRSHGQFSGQYQVPPPGQQLGQYQARPSNNRVNTKPLLLANSWDNTKPHPLVNKWVNTKPLLQVNTTEPLELLRINCHPNHTKLHLNMRRIEAARFGYVLHTCIAYKMSFINRT